MELCDTQLSGLGYRDLFLHEMKVTVALPVREKSHSLINVVDDLSIKGKLIPNFETNY